MLTKNRKKNKLPKGHVNMSLAEVIQILKTSKIGMADDYYFAKYIYTDIETLEDVEKFIAQLDADHNEQLCFGTGCIKAKVIREYLKKDFWKKTPDRLRSMIAYNRRVCCSCHETGSYKRLDQLPSRQI